MGTQNKQYEAIVIGAGHAGAEAAHALAKLGHRTLLITLSLEAVAFLACNPNIGGTAKGHLVKEIDALGGLMPRIADQATLQTKLLNRGNGPAVHSLRAQVDKNLYHRLMKAQLERLPNLDVLEAEVKCLLLADGRVTGVRTTVGDFAARAVVLATGVYLDSRLITGESVRETGPSGFQRSVGLSASLQALGVRMRRFKTGTPPRVLARTVDFDRMQPQPGEEGVPTFSSVSAPVRNDKLCYLTYTNARTHRIILDNLHRSPLYNGAITGVGPRYCPSIETKVVRFADKERHQIFIEPEGADTDELYVQGLSTSLPYDVQDDMVHSLPGLEHAHVTRYGYAIEYDCLDPLELTPTLELKKVGGLFGAGQLNGSSGYEEAAAQGLMAGLNAACMLQGREGVVLGRDVAYIGVLIDDLVTKGTQEPYRMMTSRAEYRLRLRQDNADERLCALGRSLGLLDEERWAAFCQKQQAGEAIRARLSTGYAPEKVAALFEKRGEPVPKSGITGAEILRRANLGVEDLLEIDPAYAQWRRDWLEGEAVRLKYQGYLEKEERALLQLHKMEQQALPQAVDYETVEGLRLEARQKLNEVKPLTLAQAARIAGVTPADVGVLSVWLAKRQRG